MPANELSQRNLPRLPLWTWLVPLPIFALGYEVASLFRGFFGSSIVYLPITLGIVLVHWWGPRVLTPLYISSIFFTQSWGATIFAPLIATHDSVCVLLSWLLYRKMARGDCRLESIQELVKFLMLGVLLPICVNSLYYPFIFRVYSAEWIDYWRHVGFLLLSDFTTCFAIIVPILFFLTPIMDRLGLTLRYSLVDRQAPLKTLASLFASDALLVLVLLLVLSFTVGFEKYWFIYGISALYLSVRHGFEIAIIGNATVFMLIYFLPLVLGKDLADKVAMSEDLTNFHLGMCLLYVCTAVVGRVISDLKNAEQLMQSKNRILELTNEELHHTNRELDRFVYSVSHDLSAPLKSMMGLVNISRIEPDVVKLRSYFDLIGNRIEKLENFIAEVLDFSKSNRKELKVEKLDLSKVIDEVIANHQDSDDFGGMIVERRIKVHEVQTDRLLLKIILNNLVSNAIKYQKTLAGHQSVLGITCMENDQSVLISVKDNGEGIPEEIHHRLFTMFFRGHSKSTGSGLGLYIAKEAATRIQAKITFTSHLGQGSEFTVKLPK